MQTALFTPHWTLTHLPPLIPLEFMAVALRMKMSALIDACDGSVFHHCWDIGAGKHPTAEARPAINIQQPTSNGRNSCRRELRVFYADVDAVLAGRPIPDMSFKECVAQFIPQTRGLKGTELQKLWTCGPDLIHDLDAAGLLQVERERAAAVGPRASRLYTRASIVQFLASRFQGDAGKS